MVSIFNSRGMSLGLEVRFLRATAFPIDTHGCGSWAMTNGDNDAMMHSNCCVTVDCSTCHVWRGKRTNGCWTRLGLFLF